MPARRVLLVCSTAASLSAAGDAIAGGAFSLRYQSAYGLGAAFAGVAAGGSLSTMFWNPASLADVRGIELEASGTGLLPTVDVNLDPQPPGFPGADEGNIAENAVVPAGYAAYRLSDRLVLGVGINAPFGLTTEYDHNSILRQTGIAGKSEVFSLSVNPALAFEVADWLSLGVGLQVQYFDAKLTQLGLGPLGRSTIEGDGIGYGFTAGIRAEPRPGTVIGLGYRSGIDHELEGTLRTENAGNFNVDFNQVDLPAVLTLGVRQRVTDRLRLLAGAEWTNWSRFGTIEIEGGPAPIDLPFQYEDGWYLSVGGEYDLTERATLRAGIGQQISPIGNDERTYRLPYNDGFLLGAGTSYRLGESLAIDLAYGFSASEDMSIRSAGNGGPAANGPFSGHADTHIHYVAVGFKMRW